MRYQFQADPLWDGWSYKYTHFGNVNVYNHGAKEATFAWKYQAREWVEDQIKSIEFDKTWVKKKSKH